MYRNWWTASGSDRSHAVYFTFFRYFLSKLINKQTHTHIHTQFAALHKNHRGFSFFLLFSVYLICIAHSRCISNTVVHEKANTNNHGKEKKPMQNHIETDSIEFVFWCREKVWKKYEKPRYFAFFEKLLALDHIQICVFWLLVSTRRNNGDRMEENNCRYFVNPKLDSILKCKVNLSLPFNILAFFACCRLLCAC